MTRVLELLLRRLAGFACELLGLGQAWREYLVVSERELREINHATDSRELTGNQAHSAWALFDNGLNGKETPIAKLAMIQGLHAKRSVPGAQGGCAVGA